MKKIAITALSATIIATGLASLYAESSYSDSTKSSIVAKQEESTLMRTKYYNEYKMKGYDMSTLEAYLDASKTSEGEYWAVFKVIKDKKEIPERREYVAKLSTKGYDVSGFTEAVITDAGKFWEMVKAVEYGKKPTTEVKKEEYKKVEPVKQEYKEEVVKKVEEKKTEVTKKIEDKKAEVSQKMEEKKSPTGIKISTAKEERLVKMMTARIAKIPDSTREATLVRLQDTLTK